MKAKFGWAIAVAVLGFVGAVYASEYNFYEQADKKGCDSIITESGQRDCAAVQAKKNDACGQSVDCDVDKQARTIEKYKDAQDRLANSDLNDSEKDAYRKKVENLKRDLDNRKAAAHDGIDVAQACVTAREDVQKWFAETGIPLTEQTRDDALQLRRELLDKLADAQKKQADAKAKRSANPDDSSARDDYDRASEEMRDAESALADFNAKYGKDIERYAAKLIQQYKDARDTHDKPLADARNRVDNCKKIDDMDY